jgi:epsilon-lactone hydrolase
MPKELLARIASARQMAPLLALVMLSQASAESPPVASPEAPHAAPPASVRIVDAHIPFSSYASAEARDAFIKALKGPAGPDPATGVEGVRAFHAKFADEQLAEMRRRYAVSESSEKLGGVRVDVVVPEGGVTPEQRERVLINLHGGGFMWGAGSAALLEAIPIAAVGRVKVVTVDYRLAPEHVFPAASEDVAAVYRTLLKTYKPENIGLYGCSAGGILAAQSVAWFSKEGLPRPGAIASLCGTGAEVYGDSAYLAPVLGGQPAVPPGGRPLRLSDLPYLHGVDARDPLAYPAESDTALSAFPPTLLLAGSRDFAASSLTVMHRRLRRVGVPAELFLFDGLWHAFVMVPSLPESREAYDIVVRFFNEHLGADRGGAK